MEKAFNILLVILIASTIAVDLRLSGISIVYVPGIAGAGLPRCCEIIALLMFVMSLHFWKSTKLNRYIILFTLVMTVFSLFKPEFMAHWRSNILIPSLILLSVSNQKMDDKKLYKIMLLMYVCISISSLLVILSTRIDFGVAQFWADADNGVERYLGFGQSLPYQACYSLFAIPIYGYLQNTKYDGLLMKLYKYGTLVALLVNIVAIVLTGARTAYVILFVLGIIYFKNLKKKLTFWHILIAVGVFTYYVINYQDLIMAEFTSRNSSNLAGRDEVWYIAAMLILFNPILGIRSFSVEGREFGSTIAHCQNGFFEICFWGGIFMLVLYLYIGKKIYDKNKFVPTNHAVGKGLVLIFVLFMMSEILFYSDQAYYPFMILLGALYSNSKYNLNEL